MFIRRRKNADYLGCFFFSLCGIFNLLAFISQELLALKEAKHYRFSFYTGIFLMLLLVFKREQSCRKSKFTVLNASIFHIFTSSFFLSFHHPKQRDYFQFYMKL